MSRANASSTVIIYTVFVANQTYKKCLFKYSCPNLSRIKLPEDRIKCESVSFSNSRIYRKLHTKLRQMKWQTDDYYCDNCVKRQPNAAHGPRLLNLVDTTIFDFLMDNMDRCVTVILHEFTVTSEKITHRSTCSRSTCRSTTHSYCIGIMAERETFFSILTIFQIWQTAL